VVAPPKPVMVSAPPTLSKTAADMQHSLAHECTFTYNPMQVQQSCNPGSIPPTPTLPNAPQSQLCPDCGDTSVPCITPAAQVKSTSSCAHVVWCIALKWGNSVWHITSKECILEKPGTSTALPAKRGIVRHCLLRLSLHYACMNTACKQGNGSARGGGPPKHFSSPSM
jgi:hypothetical protein